MAKDIGLCFCHHLWRNFIWVSRTDSQYTAHKLCVCCATFHFPSNIWTRHLQAQVRRLCLILVRSFPRSLWGVIKVLLPFLTLFLSFSLSFEKPNNVNHGHGVVSIWLSHVYDNNSYHAARSNHPDWWYALSHDFRDNYMRTQAGCCHFGCHWKKTLTIR